MEQQTPVQWLALRYHHRQGYLSQEDIEQAKQMEADKSKADCDVARMQGWSKGYDEGHDEGFSKGYEEAMYDLIKK